MSPIHQGFDSGMYLRSVAAHGDALGTLLYIHGLGESCLSFEGLMQHPRLARWNHLAPDLPGYGKSPWLARPRSLEEHADGLALWLRGADAGPVVIVGHSMGGVIGLHLAERHPDLVQGFLDIEGNISKEDCGFSGKVAVQSLAEWLGGGFQEAAEGIYATGFEKGEEAHRTYYASVRMCDPRAYHRNSGDLVETSQREDIAPRLAALHCPVLYLLGDPRGTGQHSRSLLEGAGIPWRGVRDTGHWLFLDRPEAFVDEIVPFLDGLVRHG